MEPTAAQLEQMKRLELDALRNFIAVCDKLGLTYYLLGGTMLGAVRHQGFIPWDDDIDVGMPRGDYDRFVHEGQSLLSEKYFIQTHETDPEYFANYAKIRINGTTFIEESTAQRKIHHGVFIDVFPLDLYPDRHVKSFYLKKRILDARIRQAYPNRRKSFKTTCSEIAAKLIHPSLKKAVVKRERLFTSVQQGVCLANHCGAWGAKEIIPSEWYDVPKKLLFEGIEANVPAQYEKWLTQVYGDYMQLPPLEKRKSHHYTTIVDLDKPYTKYIKED